MRIDSSTKVYLGNTEIVKIKKGNNVIWEGGSAVEPDYLCFENTSNNNGQLNVFVDKSGSPTSGTYATSVQYSNDKTNWTTLDLSATGNHNVTFNSGDKIYFRNNSGVWGTYISSSKRCSISFKINNYNVTHSVSGDVMTLVDYENASTATLDYNGTFGGLFSNNGGLNSAENLKLPTTLGKYCFEEMFQSCNRLTISTIPALNATTLEEGCYSGMFSGCISLTTSPTLNATTLANYCYKQMFQGCISLITAPTLPATTLEEGCYLSMFQGCTSLNDVTSYADNISASRCLSNWLANVASSGTFHNLGSATYPSGASGIPTGWTEVNS